jgi:hypothetical protein
MSATGVRPPSDDGQDPTAWLGITGESGRDLSDWNSSVCTPSQTFRDGHHKMASGPLATPSRAQELRWHKSMFRSDATVMIVVGMTAMPRSALAPVAAHRRAHEHGRG